jgi:hypothetical protein
MREFYELVVEHGVLRTTSVTLIKETIRAWTHAGLVEKLEVYHVSDPCEGADEKRIKVLAAWNVHPGWGTIHTGSSEEDWGLPSAPPGPGGQMERDPTSTKDSSQKEKK